VAKPAVQSPFKTVDGYIAAQPKNVQTVLKRVRSIIRKAVPGAEEVVSYGMPAYKLHGSPVLFLAGWKQHYSLYPGNGHFITVLRAELAPYEISKGTIRFSLSEPIPGKLIERIAKLRAKEVDEGVKAKAAVPKKR